MANRAPKIAGIIVAILGTGVVLAGCIVIAFIVWLMSGAAWPLDLSAFAE
jgi:hypothetical protein